MSDLETFKMDGREIHIVDDTARAGNVNLQKELDTTNENVAKNAGAISDETARAETAEKVNASAINAEKSRAMSAESVNATAITSETDRAKAAEEKNAGDIAENSRLISEETTRAKAAEEANASAISTETSARISADNQINANATETQRQNVTDITIEQVGNVYSLYQTKDGNKTLIGTITDTKGSGSGSTEGAVTDVTLTNENGVYTLYKVIDDTTTVIGTIETSKSDNPVIEVKDSIVEDDSYGSDYHTLSETTEDGTENNIGSLYLARKQIVSVAKNENPAGIQIQTIDQSGKKDTQVIEVGSPVSIETYDLSLTPFVTVYQYAALYFSISAYFNNTNVIAAILTSDSTKFNISKPICTDVDLLYKSGDSAQYNLQFPAVSNEQIDANSDALNLKLTVVYTGVKNIGRISANMDDGNMPLQANRLKMANWTSSPLTMAETHDAGTLTYISQVALTGDTVYSPVAIQPQLTINGNTSDAIILAATATASGLVDVVIYFQNQVASGTEYTISAKMIDTAS